MTAAQFLLVVPVVAIAVAGVLATRMYRRLSGTLRALEAQLQARTQEDHRHHCYVRQQLEGLERIVRQLVVDLDEVMAEPARLDLVRDCFLPVPDDLMRMQETATRCGPFFELEAERLTASLSEVIGLVGKLRHSHQNGPPALSVDDFAALRIHALYARREVLTMLSGVEREREKWGAQPQDQVH